MRRHRDDDRYQGRRRRGREEREGGSQYGHGYGRDEDVGRPVSEYVPQGSYDQRGMAGYGGGGSFGGMGYPMGVGGHGTYVAGHRPTTGSGYGPGGEAYGEPPRSRDWAPYRDESDWPRRQHVGERAEGPGQQQFDRPMERSYGSDKPRWSSQAEQSFRGRGPRGYRRSDERIREDVCDRLTEDHDIDASDIDVKVEACEVTLEGTVEERRFKWLAEEIASRCAGVVDVHNHLRVKRQPVERPERESEAPRNGGRGQTQTAQTGLGAQHRTDR